MSERALSVKDSLASRHRAEWRFRFYGQAALIVSIGALLLLLGSLIAPGLAGLGRTEARLSITDNEAEPFDAAHTGALVRRVWLGHFGSPGEAAARPYLRLLAPGYEREAFAQMPPRVPGQPSTVTLRLPLIDAADLYERGRLPARDPGLTSEERQALGQLQNEGALGRSFHWGFLTHGDSRAPEKAGLGAAIAGSLMVLAIALGLAFPVGVLTAVYLEEFAGKGRGRDLIEVNINNLAAVPSILYGLLGLAVYLNLFGLPRSSALAGGLTLALLILPVIIIATRAALSSVPPSLKSGALALGASPLQVVLHHSLPLSLPGILTGTILAVARAIGETAPLLMIGMVAFVADVPHRFSDPASALPVEIYLWAGSPERGFAEKTASAILVLMAILLCLNFLAIFLRRRYERRW